MFLNLLGYAFLAVMGLSVVVGVPAILAFILLKPLLRRRLVVNFVAVPTAESRFPLRDKAAISRRFEEFGALGFERPVVFTWESKAGPMAANLCYLLVQREAHCFALLQQGFSKKAAGVLTTTIVTIFNDEWSIAACDYPPEDFLIALRRPRRLGLFLPGAAPEVLYARHLTQRVQVMERTGLKPLDDLRPEVYWTFVQTTAVELRQRLRRTSVMTLFEMPKKVKEMPDAEKLEWWGEVKPFTAGG
jgi:hypothetical protein